MDATLIAKITYPAICEGIACPEYQAASPCESCRLKGLLHGKGQAGTINGNAESYSEQEFEAPLAGDAHVPVVLTGFSASDLLAIPETAFASFLKRSIEKLVSLNNCGQLLRLSKEHDPMSYDITLMREEISEAYYGQKTTYNYVAASLFADLSSFLVEADEQYAKEYGAVPESPVNSIPCLKKARYAAIVRLGEIAGNHYFTHEEITSVARMLKARLEETKKEARQKQEEKKADADRIRQQARKEKEEILVRYGIDFNYEITGPEGASGMQITSWPSKDNAPGYAERKKEFEELEKSTEKGIKRRISYIWIINHCTEISEFISTYPVTWRGRARRQRGGNPWTAKDLAFLNQGLYEGYKRQYLLEAARVRAKQETRE